VYNVVVRWWLLLVILLSFRAGANGAMVVVTDVTGRADLAATETLLAAIGDIATFQNVRDNRELVTDAMEGGSCTFGNGGCWRRIASLSGATGAWVLVPAVDGQPLRILRADDDGDKATEILRNDAIGWRHAVQRLLGKEAALILQVSPADGSITLDGANVLSGIQEGILIGHHVVVASAPGYDRAELAVELQPGETKTLRMALMAGGNNGKGQPAVFWSGVALIAVGVAAQPLWLTQLGYPCPKGQERCEGTIVDRNLAVPAAVGALVLSAVGVVGIVMVARGLE
jgi:hypothetical protein